MAPASPFVVRPLRRPTLWRRLLGRVDPEDSVVALNNLLARAGRPSAVTEEAVAACLRGYADDPRARFPDAMASLYRTYLLSCLGDRRLEPAETEELRRLRHLLRLRESAVSEIHEETASRVYGAALAAAMADDRVDPEERAFLQRLRAELSLPEELTRRLYRMQGRGRLEARLEESLSDQRLTPEEERELAAIARNLDVTLELDSGTRERLVRYRLYWLIENAELPRVEAEIPLEPGEVCHLALPVEWYDRPSEVRRSARSVLSPRAREARRLYWRCRDVYWPAGGDGGREEPGEAGTRVDSGRVYLTSGRVVFVGVRTRVSLPLRDVRSLEPFRGGVGIVERRGSRPFLGLARGADVLALVLERLVRESVAGTGTAVRSGWSGPGSRPPEPDGAR